MREILNYQTEYQLIQVFEDEKGLGKILCLDGVVQLTTYDWYRYHEAMAAVPYLFTRYAERVAILGGGDGYAAKVLLERFPVKEVVIVELDGEVVDICKALFDFPSDNRLQVVGEDAWEWAKKAVAGSYDLVLMDYTDPTSASAGKLYTKEHFQDIKKLLSDGGVVCTQMAAPVANPKAAACLVKTMAEVFTGWIVAPYRVWLPGQMPPSQQGFCLASRYPIQLQVPPDMAFLNPYNIQSMFWLDNDEGYDFDGVEVSTEQNRLYSALYGLTFQRHVEEWQEEL